MPKPCYKYLRKTDKLKPLYAQDGMGDIAQARVKLFTPDHSWTWYVTEWDGNENGTAFGMFCDERTGITELGYIKMPHISQIRGSLGLPIERDLHWMPRTIGRIKQEIGS